MLETTEMLQLMEPEMLQMIVMCDVGSVSYFVYTMCVRLFLYIRLWCFVSVFCLFSEGGAGRGCCAGRGGPGLGRVAVGWARLGWAGMEWDGMD